MEECRDGSAKSMENGEGKYCRTCKLVYVSAFLSVIVVMHFKGILGRAMLKQQNDQHIPHHTTQEYITHLHFQCELSPTKYTINNTQEAALAILPLTMRPVKAEPVLHESSVIHVDNILVTLPE